MIEPEDFLNADGKWHCIRCAACCKLAGKLFFREWDRGDGACQWLNDKNECDIYELRPPVCRVPEDGRDTERSNACSLLTALAEVTDHA